MLFRLATLQRSVQAKSTAEVVRNALAVYEAVVDANPGQSIEIDHPGINPKILTVRAPQG